jgi:hypothetical protein
MPSTGQVLGHAGNQWESYWYMAFAVYHQFTISWHGLRSLPSVGMAFAVYHQLTPPPLLTSVASPSLLTPKSFQFDTTSITLTYFKISQLVYRTVVYSPRTLKLLRALSILLIFYPNDPLGSDPTSRTYKKFSDWSDIWLVEGRLFRHSQQRVTRNNEKFLY